MKSKITHVSNHPNKEENENQLKKETDPPSTLDSRFNQTLRNVQGSKKMDAGGKKMESKTNSSDLSCNSSQTQIPFLIMWSCFFIAWLLFSLPREHKNENRVPALMLFTAHPSVFLALVIAVMLSFAGASGSLLLIGNKARRVSTIRRCYSIMSFVSISSALSVLAFALFLESFRWVSSGIFNLRQLHEDGADSFFVFRYAFQLFRKMVPVPFLQNNQ